MSKRFYLGTISGLFLLLIVENAFSQNVGVNNTNPLSTLDVTGSFGNNIRSVTSSATLTSTDATILASPGVTLTLPVSSTVTRREILIVYNGSSGGTSVIVKPAGTDHIISNNISYAAASGITLNTGSLDMQTDGSGNWYCTINTGAQSGNSWLLTGNSGTTSSNYLGSSDNIGLSLRTNATERIHIDSLGRVGIGSDQIGAFDPSNPEKLLVDYGNTTSGTAANFTGNIAGFLQINVQNKNSGTNSSSDVVATADNGTDSTEYADFGINSSTYAPSVDNFGGPNDAYLYCYARNLIFGTEASTADMIFLINGGSIKNNTAFRIVNTTRNLVVGKGEATNFAVGNTIRGPNGSTAITNTPGGSLTLQGGSSSGTATGANLNLNGGASASGLPGSVNINASANFPTYINTGTTNQNVYMGGSSANILFPAFTSIGGVFYTSAITGQIANTGVGTSGYVLQANGAGLAPSWVTANSIASGTSWLLLGNSGITQPASPATYGTSTFGATENWIGNIDAKDFTIGTSNKERMRVLSTGNIGIGTAAPNATLDVNGYNVNTGTVLNITANSLTSGTGLNISSSGTITSGGELAQFTGNSVTTGNILTLVANGLTTGNGINITSTSTAGTANTSDALINVSRSGANAGATHTAYGVNSAVTNTGTTSTNIAGQFSASGATNNYGLIVPVGGGNVGFGTSTPNRELVVMNNGTNNVETIENTNSAGYSSIDMYDNTGALASTFGYGNSGAAAPFTSRGYFNTYGNDFVWMNSVVGATTPVLLVSGQAATPGYIGIQTINPAQLLELAPTTGTIRIDGLKSGNSFNSASTATTSTLLYSNNSTGDVYSLPTVNNATLVTSGTGVPSWKTATLNGLFWSLTGNSGTTASSSAIGTTANNSFIGTTDGKDWVLATSGYERMRISSAGNIGIQNTAPSDLLDIQSSTATNAVNVTTGNVVNITGNALTTGTGLAVNSTGTIISGGEVANFTGNSATSGNILTLSGTGLTTGSIISATAGTTTGSAINLIANSINSGNGINVSTNGLTTGTGLAVNSTGTIVAGGEIANFTGNTATSGNILTLSGTGLTTGSIINATAGTTTGNAISLTSNGVTTGNGINISANGLSSGNGLNISSTSTAGTGSGSSALLKLTRSGANASASHTAYGVNTSVTNTGSTSTNIAGQFNASGATNNYAIIVPSGGGNVGIGTAAPVADAQLALKDGHLQSQQTTAPTSAGGGATIIGSTGTVSLANSTDIAGKITITASGTAASATGTMITVTFNKAYTTAPVVIITPTSAVTSAAFANDQFFVSSTTTTFTIGDGVKISNGSYTFNYEVIETQ